MERRDKINYYLDIAETVSKRGTCLHENYGAIIVKNDEIISTGYLGAPRTRKNCTDLGYCTCEKALGSKKSGHFEFCRAVHAEANAIVSASRRAALNGTLYLVAMDSNTGEYVENASCCAMCRMLIINAGISTVIIRNNRDEYTVIDVDDEWVTHDETI
ncbi:MAG: cytidine deaminase [Ruminococcaceae bacterium]|jgi:dCMP deaminase|nr:cytidine deaminase [Oscillospiraceae bacterium]